MLQPATITWERQNKDGHVEHSLNIVTNSGPMLSDQHDWQQTGNVCKTLPHTHSGVSHRMGGPDNLSHNLRLSFTVLHIRTNRNRHQICLWSSSGPFFFLFQWKRHGRNLHWRCSTDARLCKLQRHEWTYEYISLLYTVGAKRGTKLPCCDAN